MDVSQLFEQFSQALHLERMVIEDRLHELEQEDPPLPPTVEEEVADEPQR
jgi:hypothetical protein